MKTAYAIVGLCAIIVLVGGYLYIDSKKKDEEAMKATHIMLYKEYGFITWKGKNDTEYKRVEDNEMELPNDVYVKTVDGRGYVILPDNSSISLDKNTEVLVSYNDGSTSVMQYLGSTYHRIESLVTGKTYEVRTPNTLATVRGTKLMMTYDDKKKTSKVDVTEHIVEVSKLENGTTTDTHAVSEGATAIVGGTSTELTLDIKETADIKEKNDWFEENKKIDQVIDQGGNKRETLKDIIDTLRDLKSDQREDRLNTVEEALQKVEADKATDTPKNDKDTSKDTKDTTTPKQKTDVKVDVKTDIKNNSTTTLPKVDDKKADVMNSVSTTTQPVKKLDEETFFDKFNEMFIDNFYLDEKDTACNGVSPEEKVRLITSYASASGYPFTSRTLLSFAQAIDSYCKNKDQATKTKLQGRFDDEFPFNDN